MKLTIWAWITGLFKPSTPFLDALITEESPVVPHKKGFFDDPKRLWHEFKIARALKSQAQRCYTKTWRVGKHLTRPSSFIKRVFRGGSANVPVNYKTKVAGTKYQVMGNGEYRRVK